jgi:putative membrane protein
MRTVMAADRTLMAWIRTSMGLLTFGYTIYKILQEVQNVGKVDIHDNAPRNTGVFLTLAGTVALIMGIAEYCGTIRLLRRSYPLRVVRPSLIMSLVMASVGVLLFFGIIVRVL